MTTSENAYRDNLAWLYSLERFGIKLGLENMQRLVGELSVAPAPQIIHVAGTNGKGSVCAMLEAICRAHGLRTGLFTSPHLVTFRERIQVNGQLISEEETGLGLREIRDLIGQWDPHPTFFEVTTALALKHFADTNLDVVILETGLGGRLDATNAIPSTVSVITPIDFDHQKWLGNSIEEIASEKAGIIKSRTPVVCSRQTPAAAKVIRARAVECDSPVEFVEGYYDRGPIALRGAHQKQNAAVAIAALRAANLPINDSATARGLISIDWPARFQRWDDRTIIDGAHNPGAARVLAEAWREIFTDQPATIILAVLSDKDVAGIVGALEPIAGHVILPPIRSERAMSPEELAKIIGVTAPQFQFSITPTLPDAFELARSKSSPVLVTGSLHFAGEAIAFLQGRPAAFEECGQ
ncbi:MAG TPA: folylpolyglutamate synthase/dihydrofolate synthase family protein [Chthoniobacterales bacterium]